MILVVIKSVFIMLYLPVVDQYEESIVLGRTNSLDHIMRIKLYKYTNISFPSLFEINLQDYTHFTLSFSVTDS